MGNNHEYEMAGKVEKVCFALVSNTFLISANVCGASLAFTIFYLQALLFSCFKPCPRINDLANVILFLYRFMT